MTPARPGPGFGVRVPLSTLIAVVLAGAAAAPPAVLDPARPAPQFVCPRCFRESHHPGDRRWGYCGACHDFTGTPDPTVPGDW